MKTKEIPEEVREKLGENQILIRVENYRPGDTRFYSHIKVAYVHPTLRSRRRNDEILRCFCGYLRKLSPEEGLEKEKEKWERHLEEEKSPSGTPYWRAGYRTLDGEKPELVTEIAEEVET